MLAQKKIRGGLRFGRISNEDRNDVSRVRNDGDAVLRERLLDDSDIVVLTLSIFDVLLLVRD